MMRRRRTVRALRERWVRGPWGPIARAINSQAGMAAITPRAGRVAELVGLREGRRYLDIGCGTASYAHLLAAEAGLAEPPVTLDLLPGPGPVAAVGWPEALPFRDGAFDAITCLYYVRRFDDDVLHNFAAELRRVLAPGGAVLMMDIAPVKAQWLNRLHERLFSFGMERATLRGWRRLATAFTDVGFDSITLVNAGPFLVPPVPRVGVLGRVGDRS